MAYFIWKDTKKYTKKDRGSEFHLFIYFKTWTVPRNLLISSGEKPRLQRYFLTNKQKKKKKVKNIDYTNFLWYLYPVPSFTIKDRIWVGKLSELKIVKQSKEKPSLLSDHVLLSIHMLDANVRYGFRDHVPSTPNIPRRFNSTSKRINKDFWITLNGSDIRPKFREVENASYQTFRFRV